MVAVNALHAVQVRAGHKNTVQYIGASSRLTHGLSQARALDDVAIGQLI